jgi:hypothetical protein
MTVGGGWRRTKADPFRQDRKLRSLRFGMTRVGGCGGGAERSLRWRRRAAFGTQAKQARPYKRTRRADFIARSACDGAAVLSTGSAEEKRDFSLRRPTTLQEQSGKKKRRPAPFEMTVGWVASDKSISLATLEMTAAVVFGATQLRGCGLMAMAAFAAKESEGEERFLATLEMTG